MKLKYRIPTSLHHSWHVIARYIVFMGLILSLIPHAQAAWANTSYNYTVPLTISSSNVYQYPFTLHSGSGTSNATDLYCNGHCQSGFQDVRFYLNNSTLLSYFLNASDGILYVNMTNPGTIDFYYNNSTVASASNNNSTFYGWFYDFEGTTHGFSAGSSSSATSKFNSNTLSTAAGSNSKVVTSSSEPYSITQWIYLTSNTQLWRLFFQRNATHTIAIGNGAGCTAGHFCYNPDGVAFDNLLPVDTVATANTWHKVELVVNTNGTFNIYIDDSEKGSGLYMYAAAVTAKTLNFVRDDGNAFYIDGIYARSNVSFPAPTPIASGEFALYNNNYTDNTEQVFSIPKNTNVTFSSNLTVLHWCVESTCTMGWFMPTFSYLFSTVGTTNITVVNAIGYNITWTVTVLPYSSVTPTLISPSNGSTVTFSYPPQFGDIPFTWSLVSTSGYNMMLARDVNFNLLVVNHTLTTNHTTHSLEAGTYYWKVRTYNVGDTGNFSDPFSFTLSPSSNVTVNNSSQGVVYQLVNNQITPISGAKVELYNSTYYTYQVTGSNGYFLFTNLVPNQTYNLKASKVDEFDDSPIIPVTIIANASVATNILMQKCVSVFTCFYNKQWVTFAVQDMFFNRYPNTTITSYKDGELTVDDGCTTDYTGSCTMLMVKNQQYRLEVLNVADGISQTIYINPGGTFYLLIVTPTQEYFKTPDNANDDLTIIPSTNTINSTAAYINVSYLNVTGHANQVTATVYLTNVDGTNTTVNTTTMTISNGNFSYLVSPWSGRSYTVKLTIYDDALQIQYVFKYGFTFQGVPIDPYSGEDTFKGIIAVLFIFFVASFFSETTAGIGGIAVSGIAGVMYAMNFMQAAWFGAWLPFAIGFCFVISVVYVITQKSAKEGFS